MALRLLHSAILPRLQLTCYPWHCHTTNHNGMATLAGKDNQLLHFLNISREDTEFLRDTEIQRQRKVRVRAGDKTTLWKYMSTYLKSYDEKLVLNDYKVAERIALAIKRTSEKGENTVFFDADGGFHRVVQELTTKTRVFNHCKLFIRDINLKLTTERALECYLKNCESAIVNLASMPAANIECGGQLVSDLYMEIAKYPTRPWEDKEPNYTLLGCVSHSVLKYLTDRCLHRKTYWLSEFHPGRPEFYFLVKPSTWIKLRMMSPHFRYPSNVIFNILFDYEKVERFDKKSFVPWKPVNKALSLTAKFEKELDLLDGRDLVLMRVRPKIDSGIFRKDLPEFFLSYFIGTMFRMRAEQQILRLINQWCPEAAYECARQGYSVRLLSKDVQPHQIVDLFNILTCHPGFERSSFPFLAKTFHENSCTDDGANSDESKDKLLELRRKYLKKCVEEE